MKNLCAMDRWIISRLQSLIKSVDEKMSTYDITGSARIITDFTDSYYQIGTYVDAVRDSGLEI